MVNLSINVHQGNKDGSESYISLDVLKREDGTDLEMKNSKAIRRVYVRYDCIFDNVFKLEF